MWIDDDQWPWPHHPLELVEPPPPDDEGTATGEPRLKPITDITADVFQVRPRTVAAAAEWCSGIIEIVDGGPVVQLPDGMARLGDYIRADGDVFVVEPADGFAQRYTPAPTRD